MGWSCSDLADKVAKLWSAKCVKETGSSNVYKLGGKTYMFETSGREHDDGAITGSIMEFLPNMPDGSVDPTKNGSAVKAGSFKINGDGTVARGPAFLKTLAKEAENMDSSECSKKFYDAKKAV